MEKQLIILTVILTGVWLLWGEIAGKDKDKYLTRIARNITGGVS